VEGTTQGEATVLLQFIQLKFGQIPAVLETKIRRINAEALLDCSAKVLNANSLNELMDMSA
jgi:hypothetical protein